MVINNFINENELMTPPLPPKGKSKTKDEFFLVYPWQTCIYITETKMKDSSSPEFTKTKKQYLTINQLLVYSLIYSLCSTSKNHQCYPTEEYIAQLVGLARKTVVIIIKTLKENKLIYVKQKVDSSNHRKNFYTINNDLAKKFEDDFDNDKNFEILTKEKQYIYIKKNRPKGLNSYDLLLYSIISQFATQQKDQVCTASRLYMYEWCGCTRRDRSGVRKTVNRSLTNLAENGFAKIYKADDCEYMLSLLPGQVIKRSTLIKSLRSMPPNACDAHYRDFLTSEELNIKKIIFGHFLSIFSKDKNKQISNAVFEKHANIQRNINKLSLMRKKTEKFIVHTCETKGIIHRTISFTVRCIIDQLYKVEEDKKVKVKSQDQLCLSLKYRHFDTLNPNLEDMSFTNSSLKNEDDNKLEKESQTKLDSNENKNETTNTCCEKNRIDEKSSEQCNTVSNSKECDSVSKTKKTTSVSNKIRQCDSVANTEKRNVNEAENSEKAIEIQKELNQKSSEIKKELAEDKTYYNLWRNNRWLIKNYDNENTNPIDFIVLKHIFLCFDKDKNQNVALSFMNTYKYKIKPWEVLNKEDVTSDLIQNYIYYTFDRFSKKKKAQFGLFITMFFDPNDFDVFLNEYQRMIKEREEEVAQQEERKKDLVLCPVCGNYFEKAYGYGRCDVCGFDEQSLNNESAIENGKRYFYASPEEKAELNRQAKQALHDLLASKNLSTSKDKDEQRVQSVI